MSDSTIREIIDIFNRDYPTASDETYEFFHDVLNVLRNANYEWVSVKDRLPEPFTTVLAHYTDGRIHTVGYLDRFMTTRGTVTHWMPLPEPPESEDDAE